MQGTIGSRFIYGLTDMMFAMQLIAYVYNALYATFVWVCSIVFCVSPDLAGRAIDDGLQEYEGHLFAYAYAYVYGRQWDL